MMLSLQPRPTSPHKTVLISSASKTIVTQFHSSNIKKMCLHIQDTKDCTIHGCAWNESTCQNTQQKGILLYTSIEHAHHCTVQSMFYRGNSTLLKAPIHFPAKDVRKCRMATDVTEAALPNVHATLNRNLIVGDSHC